MSLNIIKKFFKKKEKQESLCHCPECENDLINSNSLVSDKNYLTYKCTKCSHESYWIPSKPVPILITEGVIRLFLLKKELDRTFVIKGDE